MSKSALHDYSISSVNVPADKAAKQPHVSTRRVPSHPLCLHSTPHPSTPPLHIISILSVRYNAHVQHHNTLATIYRSRPTTRSACWPQSAILVNSHGLWRARTRPLRLTCTVQGKCRRRLQTLEGRSQACGGATGGGEDKSQGCSEAWAGGPCIVVGRRVTALLSACKGDGEYPLLYVD